MKIIFVMLLVTILGFSSLAYAELINNGGLIYDKDLDITWYDYTKSLDTWVNQKTWASGLTVGGVTGWRLPNTVDGPNVYGANGATTSGYNITTSEMGHLFYTELGNKGFYDANWHYQSDYGLANKGPFANLKPDYYWSGTVYSKDTGSAWGFSLNVGLQFTQNEGPYCNALAVHDGDVLGNGVVLNGPSPVPIPPTVWLLGSGLIGLVGLKKRFKK